MRRAAAVLLLAGASLIALAPAADGHALLSSSVPASGAQPDKAPDAVTIVFTETPEPSLSSIHVLDASGAPFERGRPTPVAGQPKTLRMRVKTLPQGVYTVSWRVVSRVDGHATAGSFAFGVGVTPGPVAPGTSGAAPRASPPSSVEVAGRWLFFVGLIGVVGGSWVTASAPGDAPRGTRTLAGRGWFITVAGLIVLAEAQRRAAEAGVGGLLKTPLGHALIWRAVALAVAGLALFAASRSLGRRRRMLLWLSVLAGAGAAFAHVAAGHAAAASPEWAEVPAQWVHIVAVSVWLGGLAALLGSLRGTPDRNVASVVRRFSTVAGVAIFVVLGTGVFRSFGSLHRFSDLWSSSYGIVIIVKAGLLLALAALGAINRYRNVPRAHMTLDGLRRVSRTEVVVGVGALVAAALLASLAPPPPAARASAPAGIVVSGADFGTTVRVRLSATPGTAGSNVFQVKITDYDTGDAVRASRVSLRFTFLDDPTVGQNTLELKRDGDVYKGTGLSLSLAGRYSVAVLIERGTASQEINLPLATRCITTAVPGPPTIYTVQLGGGATAQGYVRPVSAGLSEVHVTFFAASGNEQPVDGGLTLRGSSADRSLQLTSRKLSAGHFVADGPLASGLWRFDFSANAGGRSLRGCFTETIR